MGKSDPSSITSYDCRNVLDSIQNEYEKKQREDSILSKLQEDLSEIIAQRNLLGKRADFNEKYCILCCSTFNLLFKRKVLCQGCNFHICRSCSLWNNSTKQWICNVCEKQRVLDAESRSWILSRIKEYFGQFGSAKVLQNFCRLKKLADSENDSGYGTTNDFGPLMKLLSSNSINKDLKMAEVSSHESCEDDEDDLGDEDELAEIHHSIETILEGLLGSSLDDASVDHLFPNSPLYINLFAEFHHKLVEAIQNLSKALQKALHNLPAEDGLTPTTAHAALKSVITTLVDECQDFPQLSHSGQQELPEICSSSSPYVDIFCSYDSLVAAAVINKIVEECQSKFKHSFNSMEESYGVQKETEEIDAVLESPSSPENESLKYSESGTTEFGMPVECVQIEEEIEEITQEFSDSDDDKLSSISKYSNTHHSISETGLSKQPDINHLAGIDFQNDAPTPFPEFGLDLVDNVESKEFEITQHPTCVLSWEENWLFRKKKRLPLYSNLKYQLLTYCEEPPAMFIPHPSEHGDVEQDEELSSELSETLSVGSLEFSSGSDDCKIGNVEPNLVLIPSKVAPSKSLHSEPVISSPVSVPTEPVVAKKSSEKCHSKDFNENKEVVNQNEHISSKQNGSESSKHITKVLPEMHITSESRNEKEEKLLSDNHVNKYQAPVKKEKSTTSKNIVPEESSTKSTPPRPGTIAEREHQKWLNAAPLKNNPYSAENINKRSDFGRKLMLNERSASFEEFERKLSVPSVVSEPGPNKVNCGPKSIDSELYQRDYYINHCYDESRPERYPLNKSSKHNYAFNEDYFDEVPEEALNSFEEKVYVSSGKVFTLENHVKRLEREIKDLSPTSNYINKRSSFQPIKEAQEIPEINISNEPEAEKTKRSRPCMKVHSLTARSLSREFRDLAKQNIPKQMNRTVQVPIYAEDGTSERDSLCSPESAHSNYSNHPADNGHGYTSDESNTSNCSVPCSKSRRQISRSILERATYWERRAEQGLLSDDSVIEEFPAIEMNP